jgi:hypothetical protein
MKLSSILFSIVLIIIQYQYSFALSPTTEGEALIILIGGKACGDTISLDALKELKTIEVTDKNGLNEKYEIASYLIRFFVKGEEGRDMEEYSCYKMIPEHFSSNIMRIADYEGKRRIHFEKIRVKDKQGKEFLIDCCFLEVE